MCCPICRELQWEDFKIEYFSHYLQPAPAKPTPQEPKTFLQNKLQDFSEASSVCQKILLVKRGIWNLHGSNLGELAQVATFSFFSNTLVKNGKNCAAMKNRYIIEWNECKRAICEGRRAARTLCDRSLSHCLTASLPHTFLIASHFSSLTSTFPHWLALFLTFSHRLTASHFFSCLRVRSLDTFTCNW